MAGHTTSYHFDKDTKEFELSYTTATECSSRITEVYFNRLLHYPDGYEHTVTPASQVSVTLSAEGFRILLEHADEIEDGSAVTFTMKPKAATINAREGKDSATEAEQRPMVIP